MEFTFGDECKGGTFALGLHMRGSFMNIVNITDCHLVHEDVNLIRNSVRDFFDAYYVRGSLTFRNNRTHIGYLRHLLVRRAEKTGEIKALIDKHHAIRYEHTDWLIQDGFGQPMNPGVLTNHILSFEKKNGLPHISVHGLRHTFASMLNSEGIDIARISAELGHSNITTTLNVYTHVFGGASASSRGIADALNKKLDSATSMPLSDNIKTAEA